MKHRVASLIVLVFLLSTVIAAQITRPRRVNQPVLEEVSAGDVVRINTTLVTVPVSVLDRQGRFVSGLKREDFHLFEDGVEQSIVHFEPTEMPFTVALLLDTSASTRFHLSEIKEAAITFAKKLRPQDRVLVVTFSDEVLTLTEATSDLELITDVIEADVRSGQSTRLYDAVNLVMNERLNKIKGRKAIVLFTDGVDTTSYLATGRSTLHDAEELDALIYPIQYDTRDYVSSMRGGGRITILNNGNLWPFPTIVSSGSVKANYDRADRYLRALADRTGGRLYAANDPTQLADAFTSIAEELRRQYRLGYYPPAQTLTSTERHMLKVDVNKPGLAVRARNSYLRTSQ
ncbi:MAG TPA: VWA domain-containing protein [Pyrinomonadaceae bacterium]|nr:VWA domain-containing protein [Pyrinomonadaceae bacterium]